MNIKPGKIFIISAPSGTGKTTIVKNTLSLFPELVFSISATTRKRREMEVHGKEYFFITEEEFKKKIEHNEFVEWEVFYDYHYGTLKSFVDDNINNGKSVVFEVDVKGAIKIKETYPDSVMVFISPPSLEELKRRLITRNTDTEDDLKKRIERVTLELEYKDKFDYNVINEDLEIAKNEVNKIIEKELTEE